MNHALRIAPIAALVTASIIAMCAAPAAFASDVYQWKDASGVTHYSQTPPDQGKFQSRSIYHRENTESPQTTSEGPTESPQCATARKNIELLESGAKLEMDSDGDGKPDRELSDNDRDKQLQIAQTVARVNCSQATAKTP